MSAIVRLYFPTSSEISTSKATTVNPEKKLSDTNTDYSNYLELQDGDTLRIGRSKSNDLVIQNPSVSRFHAALSVSASGAIMSDFSSLNGTFVNSRKITHPSEVKSHDYIEIGEIKFRLEFVGQSSKTTDDESDSLQSTQASQLSTQIVTVLLADICSYTSMSQVLPAEKLISMLNLWTSEVTKIVIANLGEVDKYIGDCVMCLWKSNARSAEESAALAYRTAVEIADKTKSLVKDGRWEFQKEYPWKCRIALNSGEAVIGAMGVDGNRNYTVLGDTINVAFRLERVASKTKHYFVLSDSTVSLLGDSQELIEIARIELEGRTKKTSIFTPKYLQPK